jgi:hypothetical protein
MKVSRRLLFSATYIRRNLGSPMPTPAEHRRDATIPHLGNGIGHARLGSVAILIVR